MPARSERAIDYAHGAAHKLLPNHFDHEAYIADLIEQANAAVASGQHDEYERLINHAEEVEASAMQAAPSGARVLSCRVTFSNPLEVDGDNYTATMDLGKVLRDARDAGYDALILTNILDTPSGMGPIDNHIAVFDPAQIEILDIIHEHDFPAFEKEEETEFAM